MKKDGFTLIELLIAFVVLAVLVMIAVPQYIPMQKRVRESEVKHVAHALQIAVEDYKVAPTWLGRKPETMGQLAHVITSYLPNNIQAKRNPFNSGQTYGVPGEGITFTSPPGGLGQVCYVATYGVQAIPYTIGAMGGDAGITILTLVEGE